MLDYAGKPHSEVKGHVGLTWNSVASSGVGVHDRGLGHGDVGSSADDSGGAESRGGGVRDLTGAGWVSILGSNSGSNNAWDIGTLAGGSWVVDSDNATIETTETSAGSLQVDTAWVWSAEKRAKNNVWEVEGRTVRGSSVNVLSLSWDWHWAGGDWEGNTILNHELWGVVDIAVGVLDLQVVDSWLEVLGWGPLERVSSKASWYSVSLGSK